MNSTEFAGQRCDALFVVTGGPGSGKSTLLAELANHGYAHSVEAGRAVIKDQRAVVGSGLPWLNRELFAELMLSWEIRSYEMAKNSVHPFFFDRGVPDVMAYLRVIDAPIPLHFRRAAEQFRYASTVFIAPPWPEIYVTDEERKQSFDEAVRTYELLAETYIELGYNLCILPRTSVEERARFVLSVAIPPS